MSRVRTGWLAERHSLGAEAALVLGVYAIYETSWGLVAGGPAVAVHHARMIASLERSLHIFVEANVQHAFRALPGLIGALGFLYLTLHLAATGTRSPRESAPESLAGGWPQPSGTASGALFSRDARVGARVGNCERALGMPRCPSCNQREVCGTVGV